MAELLDLKKQLAAKEARVASLVEQKEQQERRIRQLEAEVPAGFAAKTARLGLSSDRGSDYRGEAPLWTGARVRQTFIDFFVQKKAHTHWPSSPVVPHNDPTLLFANAGMNQYKPIFLGQADPAGPLKGFLPKGRATNSQKCIRAGGKHNDLEDVGKDVYHHTFFEMLGNWSFGDYFKKEAIAWAWELLTEVYGLDPERLYATYFGGDDACPCDDEAREIWLQFLPAERVLPFDAKDNFWEMGDTGPCGPCTEIHYDRIGGRDAAHIVNMDDPDVLEIWNNVFIQYNRKKSGALEALPNQHVDTGMGFERLSSIMQDKRSNYDTDIFTPIFAAIQAAGKEGLRPYGGKIGDADAADGHVDMAYRVVADHIRTLTFAITDGAVPSNQDRGYVLRRVLRRGVRYGSEILGMQRGFLSKLVPTVVELMKGPFPEIEGKQEFVQEVILDEELTFSRTLESGILFFKKSAQKLLDEGKTVMPGKDAFFLYATKGFPVDLTGLMAEERGLTVDMAGYEAAFEEHRKASMGAGKDAGKYMLVLEAAETAALAAKGAAPTDSSGKYAWHADGEEGPQATVLAVFAGQDAGFVDATEAEGEQIVGIVTDATSFYAEQGGQAADRGRLVGAAGAAFAVENCLVYAGFVLHIGTARGGKISVGDKVRTCVDYDYRDKIAPNHTCTHLLNFALRKVLGGEIDQKGSEVTADKLRFDFNSQKKMSDGQIADVERIVREQIAAALPVSMKVVPLGDAKRISSLRAVFGETYPDPVRVVIVGPTVDEVLADPENGKWQNFSVELCGGTHVGNSSAAKQFALVEESAISKGIRRIVALTGEAAAGAARRAEEFGAQLDEGKLASGAALVAAEKDLNKGLQQLVISASLKMEYRDEVKKLTKRVIAWKKEEKKRVDDASKIEVQAAVAQAKEAGAGVVCLRLVTKGSAIGKLLKKEKSLKGFSVLLMQEDGGNLMVAASMTKAHVAAGHSAKAWTDGAFAVCGGRGGGKDASAQGKGNASEADAAFAAAMEYAGKM